MLCVVEDRRAEPARHVADVLGAVLDRRERALAELGVCGRGHGGLERGGAVDGAALVAVEDQSRRFEHVVELLEVLRRDVDGELGVADADELGVDVEGSVEGFTDGLLGSLVGLAGRGVSHGLGQAGLPLGDRSQEGDVLAGEVIQSRETLQGGRVAFEDVFQGAHVEDALAGTVVAEDGVAVGLPAGHHRVDHSSSRAERLGLRVGALGADFPLLDGLEGFLLEGLLAEDFPAGEQDGEDLHDDDGQADPLGGNPDLVDDFERRDVESDEPHGRRVETGNGTGNGLHTPALGVVDVARVPQNDGRNNPRPEELPEHARPPFPATALLGQDLHVAAVHLSAGDTERGVVLARHHPHDDGEEDLSY